jgi:phosphotransferase system enzyme I (PtsI)
MSAKPEIVLQGTGVSSGNAFGHVLKIDSRNRVIFKIDVEDAEAETRRFMEAIEISKRQVEALKLKLEEKVGGDHSVILDMHFLILDDRVFHDEILNSIRRNRVNAEWALAQARDNYVEAYKSLDDEYFRERYSDIEHVTERILMNLSGEQPFSLSNLPDGVVLAARDFNPSGFAVMDTGKVRGLITESGGRTTHTAILSRGLRIPAVMGIRNLMSSVSAGDGVMLYGDTGQVILNPDRKRVENELQKPSDHLPATGTRRRAKLKTKDGFPVSLCANIEFEHEIAAAKANGAEGVGLYRSELLYFRYPDGKPSMEEQLAAYRKLAEEMKPLPVSIRTLDAGAEKSLPSDKPEQCANANMGQRGIRLSLQSKDTFQVQIEAILRTAGFGRVEMTLPMITTIEEVREVRLLITETRRRLVSSKIKVPSVPLGLMLEVPAAVLMMESLAAEADFFCVGTNDLIQYLMAVDRGNDKVAYLYQPLHPCVLHCLAHIAKTSAKLKKPARICGEIAANPFYAALLLGMGFTQLSMNSLSIPLIRRVIGAMSLDDARKIARKALTLKTAKDVYEYLTPAVTRAVSINLDLDSWAAEISPGCRNSF